MENKKKRSAFVPTFAGKGWTITLMGFLFFFMYQGVFDNGLNGLYPFWEQQYGWTTPQIAIFVTIGGWIAIVGIVIFGALCKKKSPKFVSIIGLLGTAVAYPIAGYATTLPMLALGMIIFFIFSTGFGVVGMGQFGNNWFPKTKGMYMGIVTLGVTLAAATIPALAAKLVPITGISGFMWIFTVISVALAIFVACCKNYPEEAGGYPDNDSSITREELDAMEAERERRRKNSPWTIPVIIKQRETWVIIFGYGMPQMVAVGFLSQLVPALISFGHDPHFGIMLMSSMWPTALIGSYFCGVIDNKFGTKIASFVVISIEALGCLLIALLGTTPVTAAFAVGLFMLSVSGGNNIIMSSTETVFGHYEFENAWPVISVFYKILVSAGISIIAIIAASLGYKNCLFVLFAVVLVSVLIIAVSKCRNITEGENARIPYKN